MKTEGLTNQLIEAIKILKHVKAQNIEQNKMIDAFLEKVLKELGAKDEDKKEDKKKTPEEKRKEDEEDMKRGQEMIRKILEMEKLRKEKEEKESQKALDSKLEALKKDAMEKISALGAAKGMAKTPYLPSSIISGSGTAGGKSEPKAISPSTGGDGSIDTSRDHKGGGGGSPADRVVPPGKVWCTTCEEYHEAEELVA